MKKLLFIFLICFLFLSSSKIPIEYNENVVKVYKVPTLYEQCVLGTIVNPKLLQAISIVESNEIKEAIGDKGFSRGQFQLYERDDIRIERVNKWGFYNPHDPYESGCIAALYLQDCLNAFPNDLDKGISAYNKGIGGTKISVNYIYVNKVKKALENI
jgi:hypothetical protein